MKKLLVVLALMTACFAANAQYVPDGAAKRSGGHIKVNGGKLTKEQQQLFLSDIDGIDYTARWSKANSWRKAGIWLTAGGGALTVVGLGYTAVMGLAGVLGIAFAASAGAIAGSAGGEEGSQQAAENAAQEAADNFSPYITTGLVVTGVGAVSTIAGIPVTVVNCSKMNKIVKGYNNSRLSFDGSVELAPTLAWEPAGKTIAPGVGIRVRF